jgi:thiamine-phosphate pyrophosphorylase
LLDNGANLIACSSFVWKNKKYNPLQALKKLK